MKRGALLVSLVIVVVAGYPLGRLLVRRYVDRNIERTLGQPLPAFALRDENGREYSPATLAGKVAVLHFFRSRCGSCEQEKPAVRAFAASLDPSEAILVSIMTDEVLGYPPEVTRATLERSRFTHAVVQADDAAMDAFHGAGWANVTPIWYFADREGRVVRTLRGAQTLEDLQDALAAAKAR